MPRKPSQKETPPQAAEEKKGRAKSAQPPAATASRTSKGGASVPTARAKKTVAQKSEAAKKPASRKTATVEKKQVRTTSKTATTKPAPAEKPTAKKQARGASKAAPAAKAEPAISQESGVEEVAAISAETNAAYEAANIQQKSVLEAIRDLTAMYLGGVGLDALFQTYIEAFTNAADEILAIGVKRGLAGIEFDKDTVIFTDNGRGIPVGVVENPNTHVRNITLRAIFSEFHTGGKFDKSAYQISGGMHGTGAKALTAFCKKLVVETNFNGYTYVWQAENGGAKMSPITIFEGRKKLGEVSTPDELIAFQNAHPPRESTKKGTKITFTPDPKLLKVKPEEFVLESERLREVVKLVAAATGIKVDFAVNGDKKRIHYASPADYLAERYDIQAASVQEFKLNTIKKGASTFTGTLYLTRCEGKGEILSVVNNLPVPNGRHITGLTKFVSDAVGAMMTKSTKVAITPANLLQQGLLAFLVMQGQGAAYGSQAKTDLVSPDSAFFVELYNRSRLSGKAAFKEYLGGLYEDILAALNLKALKKAGKGVIFTKLANVKGDKYPPEQREVFLVEGDSAGGTCRQGRDPERQAVFPLRGKIMNVYGIPASRVLGPNGTANAELKELNNMIASEQFGRYVIMSDADVDGKHIAILIATFFHQYHRQIIKQRRLLWLIPPLYGVVKKGGEIEYARDDAELAEITKRLKNQSYSIQRYKGLGEMNPDQIKRLMVDEFEKYAVVLELDEHADGTLRFWFDGKESAARSERFMDVVNGHLEEIEMEED